MHKAQSLPVPFPVLLAFLSLQQAATTIGLRHAWQPSKEKRVRKVGECAIMVLCYTRLQNTKQDRSVLRFEVRAAGLVCSNSFLLADSPEAAFRTDWPLLECT